MHGARMGTSQSLAHSAHHTEMSLAKGHSVEKDLEFLYEIRWQALRASRYPSSCNSRLFP